MLELEWAKLGEDLETMKRRDKEYMRDYFPEPIDIQDKYEGEEEADYKKEIQDAWPEDKKAVRNRVISLFEQMNKRIDKES